MERVQEECKAFIEQYKKSECLWNTRIPNFRNQEERTEAYKKLSIMFNMTVDQVKKRICNFRSRYSLEKIKIQESILQGHSKVYTPRISWFKYLTFLDDVLIQRTKLNESKVHFESSQFENHRADGKRKLRYNAVPTIFGKLNLPPLTKIVPQNSIKKIKVEKFHQNTDDSESEDKYSNSRPRKLPRLEIDENSTTHEEENYSDTFIADNDDELLTKDNLKKKVYDVVETIIQVCQNNTDNNRDDEFDIFGKSVAAQLKSLPLDKALKLQMQLQEQISLFKIRVLQQEATQNS